MDAAGGLRKEHDPRPGGRRLKSGEGKMSNLRQEIDTEKTRADFQKWKLIAVAALGAMGLGLSQTPNAVRPIPAYLVLPLIPLICLYADLLCRHLRCESWSLPRTFV
jgi:hypothetical protein